MPLMLVPVSLYFGGELQLLRGSLCGFPAGHSLLPSIEYARRVRTCTVTMQCTVTVKLPMQKYLVLKCFACNGRETIAAMEIVAYLCPVCV